MRTTSLVILCMLITACTAKTPWHLVYKNDRDGANLSGSKAELISAVRRGCNIRVAWGVQSTKNPGRSIEHISDTKWVSVRNGDMVQVQLDEHLINLADIGEADIENGDKLVMWRVNMATDGTFDAVWYDRVSGQLIKRSPQRHIMSWFTDCPAGESQPLYAGGKPRKE